MRTLFASIKAFDGGVAQLGERLICIQEVIGSIPFTSTIHWWKTERKGN